MKDWPIKNYLTSVQRISSDPTRREISHESEVKGLAGNYNEVTNLTNNQY